MPNKTAEDVASENSKSEVASFLAEYRSNADVRNKLRSAISDPAQIPIAAEEEQEGGGKDDVAQGRGGGES
jgi:hypothetical protein